MTDTTNLDSYKNSTEHRTSKGMIINDDYRMLSNVSFAKEDELYLSL